jgi:hypothetical protein
MSTHQPPAGGGGGAPELMLGQRQEVTAAGQPGHGPAVAHGHRLRLLQQAMRATFSATRG